jgi:cytochrome c oxidase assembly protein subunit 15
LNCWCETRIRDRPESEELEEKITENVLLTTLSGQNGVFVVNQPQNVFSQANTVGEPCFCIERGSVATMRRPEISALRFRKVVWIAFGSLYVIIVTGSLVRLTGSGLGCSDWPNCNETKFVDVSSGHAAIEQINRLFTGFVAASVILAVSASLFLNPRVGRITANAGILVFGVLVQVVLGAYVVLTGLNPWSNMAHFLVSIFLVSSAFLLIKRVELLINPQNTQDCTDKRLRYLLFASACLVMFLGTVVTGAGPHSGAEKVTRLGIDLRFATQLHSASVWILILVSVILAVRSRKSVSRWESEGPAMLRLLAAISAQGFIGYVQYFGGVPAPLVAIHIALSVVVWLCVFAVFLPASNLLVLD